MFKPGLHHQSTGVRGGLAHHNQSSSVMNSTSNNRQDLVLTFLTNKRLWRVTVYSCLARLCTHPLAVIAANQQVYGHHINIWKIIKTDGVLAFFKGIEYHLYLALPQSLLGWIVIKTLSPILKRYNVGSFLISKIILNTVLYPMYLKQSRAMILDFTSLSKEETSLSSGVTKLEALPPVQVYSKTMWQTVKDWWNNGPLFSMVKSFYNSLDFTGIGTKLTEIVVFHVIYKQVYKTIPKLQIPYKNYEVVQLLISNMVALLFSHPIETIYRRMLSKSHPEHTNIINIVKEIRNDGVLSLYNGYLFATAKLVLFPIIFETINSRKPKMSQ
ncbi:hypothetical protein C9374_010897 [Naegleria lovaniensis]|uniref:Mitochondrial carrier n=1 Tax=Naegleria lovaniensis TaxID=51637 RepID=A0AA88GAU4_NAELO|nr:uncharacterized protein C9374_010897 [Naegleria lovaniensis]KAG2374327.1 hypothetical protein C9374_010897 [Naegleria lovaniensis]